MQDIATTLRKAWQTKGWLACLLWPVSLFSHLWLALNQLAYQWGWRKTHQLPVPVWIVGNVVVGGTGKTPVVMHLATRLQDMGFQVGVIARGHGVRSTQVQEVHHNSSATEVGDEALLIKQHCQVPVFTGRQRALAGQALLQAYPSTQLIISDDGLQHQALHHDLALCIFDDRGLGNGWLLPAGPLRESWPRRTAVKQYLVHTGQQPFENSFKAERQLTGQVVNGEGQTRPLASFQGQAVHALAAIAQPELFFQALQHQGLNLTATYSLPDHAPLHGWTPLPHAETLLCTEKDAVKLWPHWPQAWAVPLDCQLPESLWTLLLEDLQGLSSRHG